MQLSLKWLSEFVDVSDLNPKELAHRITMSGLEVSSTHDLGQDYQHVIIGKIKTIKPHPDADKLQLTEVEVPGQLLKIVCGAKNIAVNDVVPVAMIGAVLPGNFEIKKSKIRGEESYGMLCSQKELAIADDAQGIMHFPENTPIGTNLASLIGKDDVIFEIEVTPNRSDCLSHLGIARQLAASLNRPLKLPQINLNETTDTASDHYQVKIESGSGCHRYCARLINNVTIKPSPFWLKERLENVGVRSVNNVVDATNYVLMGIGHPLHAFDRDQLNGSTIIARLASTNEKLTSIDGKEHRLKGDELVIADEQSPVALAGVMGGLHSEVTDKTKNILLEAAWFDQSKVRKTSKSVELTSESSYRFERGVDPELGLTLALDLCAQMICELAGGDCLKGVIDNYTDRHEKKKITFNLNKAENLLGMSLDKPKTLEALKRLGYQIESLDEGYQVMVPSHRHDVSIEQDLVEDIAQIIGYDNLPTQAPLVPLLTPNNDPMQTLVYKCRAIAKENGFTEILTYSFINPAHFDQLRLPDDHPWRNTLKIRNPLSEALSTMRSTLLPGLLDTLVYNIRHGHERIHLFESGSIFKPTDSDSLPEEPSHLGLISVGKEFPLYWQIGKNAPDTNFFDMKGVLDDLFSQLRINGVTLQPIEHPFLHPLLSFNIVLPDKKIIGWAGTLHPEIQSGYKLKQRVFAAEVDLQLLFPRWQQKSKLKKHSRFPAINRDIAIAVPHEILAGQVMKKIKALGTDLLVDIIPFDQYKSNTIGDHMKSLAFSLTFQHNERTLKEDEVNQIQTLIIKELQKDFSATQR